MKKGVLIILDILICFGLAACETRLVAPPVSEQSSQQEQSDIQNNTEVSENESINLQEPESYSSNTETGERKLKLTINEHDLPVTIYNTPAANALYDMLPLELTFEDFNGIEKIAYMDNELPTEGGPDEFDPDVGDLCLYAPWGNLSIFYKDFRNSSGLISLGHIDSGTEVIGRINEDFSATLDKAK